MGRTESIKLLIKRSGSTEKGADIAAVLLRLAPADDRTLIKRVKTIAPKIQQRGIALLKETQRASSRW